MTLKTLKMAVKETAEKLCDYKSTCKVLLKAAKKNKDTILLVQATSLLTLAFLLNRESGSGYRMSITT